VYKNISTVKVIGLTKFMKVTVNLVDSMLSSMYTVYAFMRYFRDDPKYHDGHKTALYDANNLPTKFNTTGLDVD
jgi:hypothetical protein